MILYHGWPVSKQDKSGKVRVYSYTRAGGWRRGPGRGDGDDELYDERGRLTWSAWFIRTGTPTVTILYDRRGRLTQVTQRDGDEHGAG